MILLRTDAVPRQGPQQMAGKLRGTIAGHLQGNYKLERGTRVAKWGGEAPEPRPPTVRPPTVRSTAT
eukprot:7892563-Pyramimonas_sp.AAC.1